MSLTSSHWGAFRAQFKDGAIVDVRPFEHDPEPSPLLGNIAESYDHPTRIRRPAIRKGWLAGGDRQRHKRGSDGFVEVPWDEALDLVAGEMQRVRDEHGNPAIFGGSYGWCSAGRYHHAKTQLKRLLVAFGGFTDQVNNYSYATGMVLLPHVVGSNELLAGPTTTWSSLVDNAEIVLAFGGIAKKNAQVEPGGCGEHVYSRWTERLAHKDIRFVNVSPDRNDLTFTDNVDWLPIRPGADTALIMALTTTIIEEGLADRSFISTYCHGFDRYEAYLLHGRSGEAFDADWAAGICEISAETIRALARDLVRKRSFICMSWSLQRADFGEQPYWGAIALAAAVGKIGLAGQGIGFGYGCINGTGNLVSKIKAPVMPVDANPIKSFIPVARIGDLLNRAGETLSYNGSEIVMPDIKFVYWAGGNPFHHHQDLNNLARGWMRPDTIVVNEICWTATARRADIVLPATTTLERTDIGASSQDRFLIHMTQVAPPYAQARDDVWIFDQLARRLDILAEFTGGRTQDEWMAYMYEQTRQDAKRFGVEMPVYETFVHEGYFEYPQIDQPETALAAFRRDPQANALRTPSGRIEIYSERIAGFGYATCPGHPVWLEPREWLGCDKSTTFPIHLLSSQPPTRLHSQMDAVGTSSASKIGGREPIRLNPEDAAMRGLSDGMIARVFNERGACLAGVVTDHALRRGVAVLPTGAWFDPDTPDDPYLDRHGNPNTLTHDLGTSELSQGPAAQSVLVEIERATGDLPPVRVGQPPELEMRSRLE